jgi:hypothetical protein
MATPYSAGTSLSSSWTPDESPQLLFAEKGWLQGVVVSSVAFGVVVTLFCMCFSVLYRQAATRERSRQRIILWVYICIVFILNTLFIAANSKFTELAFIDDRNYPGGPAQFENDMWSIPIDEVNNVVFVLQNWMNDGMIVSVVFNPLASTRLLTRHRSGGRTSSFKLSVLLDIRLCELPSSCPSSSSCCRLVSLLSILYRDTSWLTSL